MSESNIRNLISLLSKTGYFCTLHEVRVLSTLIESKSEIAAKEISQILDLPDSKVYPALNSLIDLGLISRNDMTRPYQYFFQDLFILQKFLEQKTKDLLIEKREILDEIYDDVNTLWQPEEPELGQIARLYKGEEIKHEIKRLHKFVKSSIFYLFSLSSLEYAKVVSLLIPDLLSRDIKVELSIPATAEFSSLFTHGSPFLKVKYTNNVLQNSYIIRDSKVMFNITQRDYGDVALLTNDALMVKNINTRWDDVECCSLTPEGIIKLDPNAINLIVNNTKND